LIDLCHNAVIKLLHFLVADEVLAGRESDTVGTRPLLQSRERRRNNQGGEFAFVTNYDRSAHQRVVFQRILDGLRSDELPPRGLDQVFLSIGDGEESVAVNRSDITRFKPAVYKCARSLFRAVPIALENRGTTDEDFSIIGNADFDIGQNLSHRTKLVGERSVDRDYG